MVRSGIIERIQTLGLNIPGFKSQLHSLICEAGEVSYLLSSSVQTRIDKVMRTKFEKKYIIILSGT